MYIHFSCRLIYSITIVTPASSTISENSLSFVLRFIRSSPLIGVPRDSIFLIPGHSSIFCSMQCVYWVEKRLLTQWSLSPWPYILIAPRTGGVTERAARIDFLCCFYSQSAVTVIDCCFKYRVVFSHRESQSWTLVFNYIVCSRRMLSIYSVVFSHSHWLLSLNVQLSLLTECCL